jgi:S-(hydroxymethyl)glutathione dehydrogenase/alcohol dehydrogenase
MFALMDAHLEVTQLTYGEMADKLILSPSVVYGDLMQLATVGGKGGTVVVTHRR